MGAVIRLQSFGKKERQTNFQLTDGRKDGTAAGRSGRLNEEFNEKFGKLHDSPPNRKKVGLLIRLFDLH